MKYNILGTFNLRISAIGFGCMSLEKHQQENEKVIHAAMELGINYFDTADLYDKGENEISLGKALKGKREQVVIATKVGNQWRKEGSGHDWNPRKSYILQAVKESLKRLQTDYIDLYQLHGGTIDDPIDETIEAFEILKRQGKIRYYGISSIRPNVIREYVQRSNIVSVMMQYSMPDRRAEEACFPLLQQHHISVLARGCVAGGLLVNKPAAPYLDYTKEQIEKAANVIKKHSNLYRSAAQSAIQFVLKNTTVASAVVGIRTLDQLNDAAKAIDAPQLSDMETEELRTAIDINYYKDHR